MNTATLAPMGNPLNREEAKPRTIPVSVKDGAIVDSMDIPVLPSPQSYHNGVTIEK